MKRVLIVVYYWPPSGGAGVQRWVKLSKYLHQFGWEPVIFTPENPEAPLQDKGLLKEVREGMEVIKTPIWEPYSLYKRFTGKGSQEKISPGVLLENRNRSFTEKLSVWIRGNFFVPDARKFWVKPSVKFLHKYLEEHTIDAIVTSGPPHSMHLIALGLKQLRPIPWIADFRDPWTNIHYHDELMLGPRAAQKHQQLEQATLDTADHVVTASYSMERDFVAQGAQSVSTVTNGYDAADYANAAPVLDEKFTLTHIGTLYGSRSPEALWAALGSLIQSQPGFAEVFTLRLVGKTDPEVYAAIEQHGLTSYLDDRGYVSHHEVIDFQRQTQLLLLIFSEAERTIIPGKVFEYLAARRPVLCIGSPEWDAPQILSKEEAGATFDFQNSEGIRAQLQQWFEAFQGGGLHPKEKDISRYSRTELARKYAGLLDKVATNKA
ncbi:MAG: glycosyltransferase [Salibacteraceae bacterium]